MLHYCKQPRACSTHACRLSLGFPPLVPYASLFGPCSCPPFIPRTFPLAPQPPFSCFSLRSATVLLSSHRGPMALGPCCGAPWGGGMKRRRTCGETEAEKLAGGSFKLFLLLTSFLEGGHAVLETGLDDTEQGHFRGGPSRWEPRKGRRACVWRLPSPHCCHSLCPEPPRPLGWEEDTAVYIRCCCATRYRWLLTCLST